MSDDTTAVNPEEYKEDSQPKLPRNLWHNREKMAYISLGSTIIATVLLFYTIPIEKLKILGDVISYFYFSMSAIVLGYMGFTSMTSSMPFGKR